MSSTRKAQDPTVFCQWRYASGAEFEPGLIASLVARRCLLLESEADRELIWWLQYLSHQEGGLKQVVATLIENYGTHFGTPQMAEIGKAAGRSYTAAEVKQIRAKIPRRRRHAFPLKGEIPAEVCDGNYCEADLEEAAMEAMYRSDMEEAGRLADLAAAEAAAREKAQANPTSYPVDAFLTLCHKAANETGETSLERCLCELCLDPAKTFASAAPWYFHNLISTLRIFCRDWRARKAQGVVVTTLGREVHEVLEFTLECQKMTLIEGAARTGKSHAARTWCDQHCGEARFIEVPTGNDDAGFYRALARGLGLGSFTHYKAHELRDRVEYVLITSKILICLDEAQRIWPERNLRFGYPKRAEWLMSLVNKGVPVCLVATPQFLVRQDAVKKYAGWNSAQFQGRLGDYKLLPAILPDEDLQAVCRAFLPEADNESTQDVLAYARSTDRYLAAIETIASRARFAASKAGRREVSAKDIGDAIRRAAPSDTAMNQRLGELKTGRPLRKAECLPSAPAEIASQRPLRRAIEPQQEFRRQHQPAPELIED